VDAASVATLASYDTGDELASGAVRCGEASSEFAVVFGSTVMTFRVDASEIAAKRGPVAADFHETEPCVNSLDAAYDGSLLVTGGDDGTVRVWSVLECDAVAKKFDCRPHAAPVTCVRFAETAHLVVSASKDGTFRVSSATLGHCFCACDVRAITPVVVPKPSNNKRRAAPKPGLVACRAVTFADRDLAVVVVSCPQRGAAFASKWTLDIAASSSSESGPEKKKKETLAAELATVEQVSETPVSSVAASSGLLAFGDVDGGVAVAPSATLAPFLKLRGLHDLPVTALAFSDDATLLSASADYKINRIDATPPSSSKWVSFESLFFSLVFYALLCYFAFQELPPHTKRALTHQLTPLLAAVPSFPLPSSSFDDSSSSSFSPKPPLAAATEGGDEDHDVQEQPPSLPEDLDRVEEEQRPPPREDVDDVEEEQPPEDDDVEDEDPAGGLLSSDDDVFREPGTADDTASAVEEYDFDDTSSEAADDDNDTEQEEEEVDSPPPPPPRRDEM